MSAKLTIAGVFLLLGVQPGDATEHFRYERVVRTSGAGERCLVLDPLLDSHAAPGLRDLRLMTERGAGVPYLLLQSGGTGGESVHVDATRVRPRWRGVSFDLAMPARPYTDVELNLQTSAFVAVASVKSGEGAGAHSLGSFAIFDLRGEGLPRSTTLHLQETSAPMLHVTVVPAAGGAALTPEMVQGATVPPSRQAQTLFTTAVQTGTIVQRGQDSVATLNLPARVPIERVQIELQPGQAMDFRREVRVRSRALGGEETEAETISGVIARVHMRRDGIVLDDDRLSVPATLGTNLQQQAEVTVTVHNGSAAVLPLRSVALQTRERQMCFDAGDAGPLRLFYGDSRLAPASYDVRALAGEMRTGGAVLGPEEANPGYVARAEERPLLKRHPRAIYLALLIAVCAVSLLTSRSVSKLRF